MMMLYRRGSSFRALCNRSKVIESKFFIEYERDDYVGLRLCGCI